MGIVELSYRAEEHSAEANSLLRALGCYYPVYGEDHPGRLKIRLKLIPGDRAGYSICRSGDIVEVRATTLAAGARGIGSLLSGVVEEESDSEFRTFGILLDSCRNFVFNVDYLKRYLAVLALQGCNMVLIYTKDTYELPGEPYFGYLRGRYTLSEFQELDEFASYLGIEMVGSLQGLGHLEPVLRWPVYGKISDTSSVLLTTEDGSYALIRKMLEFYSHAFRSRRIHLGMDEAHDLGRGRYLDLNGYRNGFAIFNDHLTRVMSLCRDYGFKPMIWSDMYFRMGSRSMDYYDPESSIPAEVARAIPSGVQLVYWDYYHEEESFYAEWLRRHYELGSKPVMASGLWTWRTLWYDHEKTCATVEPCLSACRKLGVDEIIFTLWGDDGGFCDWGSALAGVVYAGNRLYRGGKLSESLRFAASAGGNYDLHLELGRMGSQGDGALSCYAPGVLWDDPLLQIYYKEMLGEKGETYWSGMQQEWERLESELIKELSAHNFEPGVCGDLHHAQNLLKVLRGKLRVMDLGHKFALSTGAERIDIGNELKSLLPGLVEDFAVLEESFRRNWYARGKSYGFEVMQIRLAGQRARLCELRRRVDGVLRGELESIPELEDIASGGGFVHQYKFLATASVYL